MSSRKLVLQRAGVVGVCKQSRFQGAFNFTTVRGEGAPSATPAIGEVARVDADFIEALCDGQSHLGREVNIGDEGGGVAICHEPPLDLRTRLGLHHALHRDAHHLRPGVSALLHLRGESQCRRVALMEW